MRPPAQGLLHRRGDHVEVFLQRLNARVDCVLISASRRDRKSGDHKAIETATVGREGVVGAMAGLGLYKSLVRAVAQLPIGVSKIPATQFRKVAASSDAIGNLCINYNEVLLSQARVTCACNALHVIEARFCRWLLQTADRAASDTVALTQEFLAEMLGVRRTSVTEVASKKYRCDHLFARRHQNTRSTRNRENFLRMLSDAFGPISWPAWLNLPAVQSRQDARPRHLDYAAHPRPIA